MSECFPFITVSGDAVLLTAEMLRVFVQGSNVSFLLKVVHIVFEDENCQRDGSISLEAAARSQKQAESEDCDQVDIEHFEKILPQLVRKSPLPEEAFSCLCKIILSLH